LPTSIFRPSEFVWELEKYVKASPTVRTKELAQEWEQVIAEIRHGISYPEGAVRLASEIRALEEKGANTTDQAERVQIKAELDRKHVELDAVLGQKRPDSLSRKEGQMSVGGSSCFARTASDDEVSLGADEYAEVLKNFFTQAGDGELCFALYGPWGRGKTFQMQRLAKKLEAEKKAKYETIFFSAWKFPNAPEVWVHLYETFARAAYPKNIFVKLPRLFRAAIAKNGAWQLVLALGILAVALYPHADLVPVRQMRENHIDVLLGAGSVAWLSLFISGIWNTTKRLSKDYLTKTSYTEKLGLQATIGEDLQALLQGWMPQKFLPFDFALWLVPIVLWAIAASTWWRFDHAPVVFRDGVYFGILMLGVLGFVFLAFGGKCPARVLLVVDDLDRCKPSQLLSVMESIKVLVEDNEISKRIQVAMLIEEDVLSQAILEKYKNLGDTKETPNGPHWSNERIIRENCEKLFTAHLRLLSLTEAETKDVLEKILGRDDAALERQKKKKQLREVRAAKKANWADMVHVGNVYRPSVVPRPPQEIADAQRDIPVLNAKREKLAAEEKALKEGLQQRKTNQAVPSNKLLPTMTFSKQEEKALINAIPLLIQKYQSACGPRTVRAFVFRYQLARLLLNQLGTAWDPDELVQKLANSTTKDAAKSSSATGTDVNKIVGQVS
jgi:hypothetical protein